MRRPTVKGNSSRGSQLQRIIPIIKFGVVFVFGTSFGSLLTTYSQAITNEAIVIATKDEKSTAKVVKAENEQCEREPYVWDGEETFLKVAKDVTPVTDKVTAHTYQTMYGQFLLPYYKKNPKMKMLEIGLGCNMNYEPGASVKVHKRLFPTAELWEAEYKKDCLEKAREKGTLEGLHTLYGDQNEVADLDRWIEESGGDFDVIIDDGGHLNCEIYTSLEKLWPTVKPGGLYFIEDLSMGKKNRGYRGKSSENCDGTKMLFSEELKKKLDQLVYGFHYGKGDLKFMFCQSHACVLGKKEVIGEPWWTKSN